MDALGLVLRTGSRARRASLVALAVLVAVVVGATAAGAAGAHRTATALDRFVAATSTSDLQVEAVAAPLAVDPRAGVALADEIGAVDGVDRVGVANGYPVETGLTDDDFMVYASVDGSLLDRLDRPRLLTGRWPAADAADEIVVNETAARTLGLGIGDEVAGPTLSPDTIEATFSGDAFAGFDGPTLHLRVVGVARPGRELSPRRNVTGTEAYASPGFAVVHGAGSAAYVTRLGVEADDPAAVTDAVAAVVEREIAGAGFATTTTTEEVWVGDTRSAHRTLALTLLGFTVVVAAAGLIVVLQALARQVDLGAADDPVLDALGLTRRERVAVAVVPAVAAAVVGSVAGAAAAIAASGAFPIGIARRAEVDPGIRVDPVVLLGVAGVALAALFAVALRAAWVATRRAGGTRRRRGAAASLVASAPIAPATEIGLRLAFERGLGRTRLPVRSAIAGAVVAIAAVVAVSVVVTSADDVAAHPARYGWTWTTMPDSLAEDGEAAAAAAAEVDGVDAVALLGCAGLTVDDHRVPTCALLPVAGSSAFTQVDGRQPLGDDEVALAPATAEDLGVAIGDTVTVDGAPRPLTVVGTVLAPPVERGDPTEGAVLAPGAFEAIVDPASLDGYVTVRYADGADPAVVQAALEAEGFRFATGSRPSEPGEIAQIRATRDLLLALVALIGVLAAVGLLHHLTTSVRRRGHDLAVLQALGFDRGDVRRAIGIQAVATAVVGLVVGIPLGVIVGRTVWRAAVASLGVLGSASVPLGVAAAVAAATLVGAVVLGLGPGRYASHRLPGDVLRAP